MSAGGVKSRRQALAMAGTFLVTAACTPAKLFGPPRCSTYDDQAPAPLPDPARELRDVYIVDGYTGLQLGTKDNPYSVRTAAEFDALMAFLMSEDNLAVHLEGRFSRKPAYRWGQFASRNVGRFWRLDGDAEVSADPSSIPDSEIDGQPLYVFAGGQSVSGITAIANHSLLADRWNAKRQTLRTGGFLVEGDGAIDGVTVKDCGSLGAETFVALVTGGTGPASITNSVYTDHRPSSSNDQVSVFAIVGPEFGSDALRPSASMEGNLTYTPGSDWVQAHTIYQAEHGRVRRNRSVGARFLYYGDYFATKGIEIDDNDADLCKHGVQLRLSPTPLPAAAAFSHENYRIGPNRFASSGANVSLDTCGPSTSTRFIRGIYVDPSLTIENVDNGAEVLELCRAAAA